MSYVYFIRGEKTGLVKIGYSKNPESRVQDIQTSSGERVKIIHSERGERAHEKAYHARFRACHERGEWFRNEGDLADFLKGKTFAHEKLDSPRKALFRNALTVGFARNPDHLEKLYTFGLTPEQVWLQGRNNESFDDVLYYFRGRPGNLILASDLRAFGDTKAEILATMTKVEGLGIQVFDLTHPEDHTSIQLLKRGFESARYARYLDNHRIARRRGREGGLAKAAAEAGRRNAVIADAIAKRLCSLKEITWAQKLWVLGEGFTMSSAQRHYGPASLAA